MPLWMGYCRKSNIPTDPQQRKAVESTDRQRDRLAAWVEARGDRLELYVEPDGMRSGSSTTQRPEYQRMLQRIRAAVPGSIAGVVVTRIDRTSRNPGDFFMFVNLLRERHLDYVALDQQFDTTTPHGRLILGILAVLAAWESDITSDRMREAAADRQARGVYVGPDVYGYDRAKDTTEEGHVQALLTPNPVESERLRTMYARYLDDDIGETRLARWLNGQGWRTKRGGRWTDGAVSHLLANAMLYAGFVQVYGGRGQRRARRPDLLPGQHPPLVDEATARAVLQRMRTRPADHGGRKAKTNFYPLTGRVWCGVCGSRMNGQVRLRDGALTYRCRKDRGPCGQSGVDAIAVERAVWDRLQETVRALDARLAAAAPAGLRSAPAPLTPAGPTAPDLAAEIERLDYLFQKGRLPVDRYEHERARLEAQMDAARTPQALPPDHPLNLTAARAMLEQFDQLIPLSSRAVLQAAVAPIVERVEIKDNRMTRCVLAPALEYDALETST